MRGVRVRGGKGRGGGRGRRHRWGGVPMNWFNFVMEESTSGTLSQYRWPLTV